MDKTELRQTLISASHSAISRRRLLLGGLVAGMTAYSVLPALAGRGAAIPARRIATKARIVIAGAGAGGLALASRLVRRLEGARITLVDARKEHLYQPGYTLIAAGLKAPGYSISSTLDHLPAGVSLVEKHVVGFDPDANKVVISGGQSIAYDFLVVATGLDLDYAAIAGMDRSLIGKNGIGSIYAGPEFAEATWYELSRVADRGGVALFTRPATDIKCAGAPIKYTFIADDWLRRRGNRGKAELIYAVPNQIVFGVPSVAEKVNTLFSARDIRTAYDHELTAIDADRRIATFANPGGKTDIKFDFINIVPPMRAPLPVRDSPLAWREGSLAAGGWMEVDKHSLRHRRFANVFALGDVAGVPKGKTAASVKWQVPVVADHLVASIQARTCDDRGLRRFELVLAVFAGILGGGAGSWALLTASYSGIADICNFADAITGLAIWFTCALGSTAVFYVALRTAGIASNFSWIRLFSNYLRSASGELET